MKIYKKTSEYTDAGIVNISSYPIKEMPKLKNILSSGQIDSNYFKVDTGSVYLKNKNQEEYYKISPYEIDTSIYGEINLNTSFNDSYYSKDSPIALNTKNNTVMLQIQSKKGELSNQEIIYGDSGYKFNISDKSFSKNEESIEKKLLYGRGGFISDGTLYEKISDIIRDNNVLYIRLYDMFDNKTQTVEIKADVRSQPLSKMGSYIKGEVVKQITSDTEKFALTFHRDTNALLDEYTKMDQTIQSGLITLTSEQIDLNSISLSDIPVELKYFRDIYKTNLIDESDQVIESRTDASIYMSIKNNQDLSVNYGFNLFDILGIPKDSTNPNMRLLEFLTNKTNYISDSVDGIPGMDPNGNSTLDSKYYSEKEYLNTNFKPNSSFIDSNIYHTSLSDISGIQYMSRMFLILTNDVNVYDVVSSEKALRNLPLYELKIVLIPIMFLRKQNGNLHCAGKEPFFKYPLNMNNFTIFPKEIISRTTDFYSYYILSDENNYNTSLKYNEETFSGISKDMPSTFSYNELIYDEYYNIFDNSPPDYIANYPANTYFKVRNDNKDSVVWDTNKQNLKIYQLSDDFINNKNSIPTSIYRYIFSIPFRNYFYGKVTELNLASTPSPYPLIYLRSSHKDLIYNINPYLSSGYVTYGKTITSYLKIERSDNQTFKAYIPNKYRPTNKTTDGTGTIDISFEAFKIDNNDVDLTFKYYC